MIRVDRSQSIPDFHEAVPLKPPVRTAGWCVALGGIAAAVVLAGVAAGPWVELAASLCVIVGGLGLAAVVMCSRHEVTVGASRVDIGTGPFRDSLATGAIEATRGGPATSWRRLFADDEIVVRTAVGRRREFVVPTRDPLALEHALRAGH